MIDEEHEWLLDELGEKVNSRNVESEVCFQLENS